MKKKDTLLHSPRTQLATAIMFHFLSVHLPNRAGIVIVYCIILSLVSSHALGWEFARNYAAVLLFGSPLCPCPNNLRPSLESKQVLALDFARSLRFIPSSAPRDLGQWLENTVSATFPPILQCYCWELMSLEYLRSCTLQNLPTISNSSYYL